MEKQKKRSKPYYCDYVRHAMRFYCKCKADGITPEFSNQPDEANYIACEKVMHTFLAKEHDAIIMIYTERMEIAELVPKVAEKFAMSEDHVWRILQSMETSVARERGLIP